jgi:hypothetical protein
VATFLGRLRIGGDERETDSKGSPLPDPAAFDVDVTAVQFDQLLDYRQSELQSAMSTSCRGIPLLKPVENIRQKIGCDAFTNLGLDAGISFDRVEPLLEFLTLEFSKSEYVRPTQHSIQRRAKTNSARESGFMFGRSASIFLAKSCFSLLRLRVMIPTASGGNIAHSRMELTAKHPFCPARLRGGVSKPLPPKKPAAPSVRQLHG